MSEHASFYKNQPRPKRDLGVTDIKIVKKPIDENVEIIDLESEFQTAKRPIRSRLRQ